MRSVRYHHHPMMIIKINQFVGMQSEVVVNANDLKMALNLFHANDLKMALNLFHDDMHSNMA